MNKVNSPPLNHNNKDFSPPPLISLSISQDDVSPIKEQFIMKIDSNQQQQTNLHSQKSPTPVTPTQDFSSLFGQFSLKTIPLSPYENQKMFTCIVCDQTFHRAHNLKSHMATHSATKPFQCDDCGKQFLRFHDLKRHQKLHTGERPHHCPNCKRSFSRLDALNRHKKTEGGSACLRSTKSKNTIATVSMPSMTTQWQVQPKALPNPFFSSSSSSNLSSSSSSPPTLPAPILSTSSSSSPPLAPLQPQPSMATSLPPFIIPFSNSTPDQDEIDVLKQRIHDLEVENRVLRSLLCNKDDDDLGKPKRQRSP